MQVQPATSPQRRRLVAAHGCCWCTCLAGRSRNPQQGWELYVLVLSWQAQAPAACTAGPEKI